MEMTGEYRIPADRAAVWQALNDPETLKAAIPGCKELVRNADGSLSARVAIKVGSAERILLGHITLSNVVEAVRYTVSGEGQAGAAGSLSGSADIKLADDPAGTLLTYAVKAEVSDELAQLGSRLDTAARKTAEAFFAAIAAPFGGEVPAIGTAPPLAPLGGEAAADDELIDRIEHRVDDLAENVTEAAEEVEEELEAAAGRGVLGGPYVWGLIALLIVIVILAVLH